MNLKLTIPESIRPALAELPDAYFIGGCVRDALIGLDPKDLDIEVHNTPEEKLIEILSRHGKVDEVGRSFAVIKVTTPDGEIHDFSLPRRENKTGQGHRDFTVEADPFMGTEQASLRRDFTINTIMVRASTGEVTDHFNGIKDLEAGMLRVVNDKTFAEDPLRVLRAFQFSARMGLQLDDHAIEVCQSLSSQFNTISQERIWEEWVKWATKSQVPSAGLQSLIQTKWMQHFPEIDKLEETPQEPNWHPEGNVRNHTFHCVDALATNPDWKELPSDQKIITMLATLCHDLGKKTHTKIDPETGKITSPAHEEAGVKPTLEFLERIGAPKQFLEPIAILVKNHMVYLKIQENQEFNATKTKARAMLEAHALGDKKTNLKSLYLVMEADHAGRPPLAPGLPKTAETLKTAAQIMGVWEKPPTCPVQGRDLLALGITPGPNVGKLLTVLAKHYYNLQFSTREEGIEHFQKKIPSIFQETGILPKAILPFEETKILCKNNIELSKATHRATFRAQLLNKITSKEEAIQLVKNTLTQQNSPEPC